MSNSTARKNEVDGYNRSANVPGVCSAIFVLSPVHLKKILRAGDTTLRETVKFDTLGR